MTRPTRTSSTITSSGVPPAKERPQQACYTAISYVPFPLSSTNLDDSFPRTELTLTLWHTITAKHLTPKASSGTSPQTRTTPPETPITRTHQATPTPPPTPHPPPTHTTPNPTRTAGQTHPQTPTVGTHPLTHTETHPPQLERLAHHLTSPTPTPVRSPRTLLEGELRVLELWEPVTVPPSSADLTLGVTTTKTPRRITLRPTSFNNNSSNLWIIIRLRMRRGGSSRVSRLALGLRMPHPDGGALGRRMGRVRMLGVVIIRGSFILLGVVFIVDLILGLERSYPFACAALRSLLCHARSSLLPSIRVSLSVYRFMARALPQYGKWC